MAVITDWGSSFTHRLSEPTQDIIDSYIAFYIKHKLFFIYGKSLGSYSSVMDCCGAVDISGCHYNDKIPIVGLAITNDFNKLKLLHSNLSAKNINIHGITQQSFSFTIPETGEVIHYTCLTEGNDPNGKNISSMLDHFDCEDDDEDDF